MILSPHRVTSSTSALARVLAATSLVVVSSTGCRSHIDPLAEETLVAAPASFTRTATAAVTLDDSPWWTSFESDSLDELMRTALGSNYELEAAFARLRAARASAWATGAPQFPSIDLSASVQEFRIDQRGGTGAQIPIRLGETYNLGPSLSYELDLFGRIEQSRDAAVLAADASQEDARALALALSGQIVEAWFDVIENDALRTVVQSQIRTGEDLLEITKSRFTNGSGSALAVLQQQRLLEATRAELPVVDGALERARYRLCVLTGAAPGSAIAINGLSVPSLPPMVGLDVPSALLTRRPDVVAAALRVRSIDRSVASAISARYPRLSLSASYNFDGTEIADIFDRTIRNLAANLVVPFIDGGQRRAEVARTKAQLDEALANLNQAFLVAIREVEDALSLERRGIQRERALARQGEISEQEVEQARRRYVGGVDSYLQVLTALQNSQTLERQLVTSQIAVLRARASLLRSLGGAVAPRDTVLVDPVSVETGV